MLLYIKDKEHGKLLIDSVLNGPFQYGTMVEPGNKTTLAMIRARTYTNLTDEEKIRESFNIKATNIVLQGLPQDIYNLVNHNEDAKQIWDRVKLLIQGSELSLKEQHEAHANEVRIQRKRYPDQIALVANSLTCLNPNQYYPQMSSATQKYYSSPAPQQLDSGLIVPSFNPFDDLIANLNKLMAFGGNRNGALAQPSVVKCYNCQEEGHFARQCTKPKRPKNSVWFKEKMLLTEALESGAYLDPEQLAFLADNGDTVIPAQASQAIPTPTAFQTDDLDAFDSDCDDVTSTKAALMANLSSYDSYVLSKEVHALYDGHTIVKIHVALSVTDTDETLELAEDNKKYFEIEKKGLSLDNDRF
ncbi:putative reverse transcriptase domain-containing protein [Tanacetum coccineum]